MSAPVRSVCFILVVCVCVCVPPCCAARYQNLNAAKVPTLRTVFKKEGGTVTASAKARAALRVMGDGHRRCVLDRCPTAYSGRTGGRARDQEGQKSRAILAVVVAVLYCSGRQRQQAQRRRLRPCPHVACGQYPCGAATPLKPPCFSPRSLLSLSRLSMPLHPPPLPPQPVFASGLGAFWVR